jgi:RimJ/RimL family protein N-acetyltransferase
VAIVDHILTTERLVLRPVTADDHAVLLAHWAAPDVRRFLFDGAAPSAAEVSEAIEASVRDFAAAGYGLWLIREKDRPDLVGTTGLRHWRTSASRSSTAWPPRPGARDTPPRLPAPCLSTPSAHSDCPR